MATVYYSEIEDHLSDSELNVFQKHLDIWTNVIEQYWYPHPEGYIYTTELGIERLKDVVLEFVKELRLLHGLPAISVEQFTYSIAAANVDAEGAMYLETGIVHITAVNKQIANIRAENHVQEKYPSLNGYFGHTYQRSF